MPLLELLVMMPRILQFIMMVLLGPVLLSVQLVLMRLLVVMLGRMHLKLMLLRAYTA